MTSISSRLANLPPGSFHYKLLVLIGLGITFEAMDNGIISFVLAQMIGSWHLTLAQIGYIGSAGLVGMAFGAILSGTMADKIGRKKIFMSTMVIYGVGTGLCGLAWSYHVLLLFRFIVGFGIGGLPPVANALIGEYAPAQHRGKMMVALHSSFAVGWLLAALLAYSVIPKYGWQIAFFVGALPALLVVYMWRILPESAMYLVSKGRYAEAHTLVAKIEHDLGVQMGEPPDAAAMPTATARKFGFFELWSPTYIRRTICLWVLWFGIVYSYYGIFTWLPSLLVKSGHTLVRSFEFVLYMTIAQIPGYLTAAYLVDKIGRKATMGSFLAICAVAAYMFSTAKTSADILMWGCIMSFCNLGAWGITHTYSAEQYPTHARASGVGWAAAWGRLGGGISAPIAVGALMTGTDYRTVFIMFTMVLVIIAADIIFLGRETAGKTLDELTEQQVVKAPATIESSDRKIQKKG